MSVLSRMAEASPFGPIFGKELRIAARRKRNHWLRFGYLAVLLLVLLMIDVSSTPRGYGQGVAARMQQQSELGQTFFIGFSFVCLGAMALICPILTSTAINSERLGKTLSILLMTPITSWQIVAGKLSSRMLVAVLLIGLSLPVLAFVRLLGGVELQQMLAVLCVCTAFAISCAAIGLFFSTLLNRAYVVILLSYASMGLLYFFVPMVWVSLYTSAGGGRAGSGFYRFFGATNPAMQVALSAIPSSPVSTVGSPWGWLWCVAIQLGLAGLLMVWSANIIRRHARREGEKLLRPTTTSSRQTSAAIFCDEVRGLGDPANEPIDAIVKATSDADHVGASVAGSMAEQTDAHASKPSRVLNNPVLWRELRLPLVVSRWRYIAGAVVVGMLLISYICADANDALRDRDLQITYAIVFCTVYWLLAVVLSSTAIAHEKETDTWTVLLTSPLSGRQIVIGKLLGLARRLLWPTVLVFVHLLVFYLAGVIEMSAVVGTMWVIIAFNSIWIAIGILLSLRVRKVTTAVIINLLLTIFFYVGLPALLFILDQMNRNRQDTVSEATLFYLPYNYLVQLTARPYGSTCWLPYSAGVSFDAFAGTLLAVGLIYLAGSAGILAYAIDNFDEIVGRAENRAISRQLPQVAAAP